MNLHSIVSPAISAINPKFPVTVQTSTGDVAGAGGVRAPQYATPGSFFGSIKGNILTVLTVNAGVLLTDQTVFDEQGNVLAGTMIVSQVDGVPGAQGDYVVSQSQTVTDEVMQTALVLQAQVQPVTWRDIQQMEGLNLGGVRWKAFLYGQVDSLVRPEKKGGDLLTIPAGNRHAGTWLIAQVLEQWPGWVSAAITLQNSPPPPPPGPPLG